MEIPQLAKNRKFEIQIYIRAKYISCLPKYIYVYTEIDLQQCEFLADKRLRIFRIYYKLKFVHRLFPKV